MIALLVIGAWLCGGLGCFYSYRLGVTVGVTRVFSAAHEIALKRDRSGQ